MKISFFGAAGTVTGSQHLVEVRGRRILLDCGLFQGKRKETFELNRRGPVDAKSVDALVLSHAHIDHSGNVPSLVRNGFTSPVYCTPATRDLCEVMLADSAHIQEKDVEFVNKRRREQGKKPFEPLYTQEDVPRAVRLFTGVHYGESVEILPGVLLHLVDAGPQFREPLAQSRMLHPERLHDRARDDFPRRARRGGPGRRRARRRSGAQRRQKRSPSHISSELPKLS